MAQNFTRWHRHIRRTQQAHQLRGVPAGLAAAYTGEFIDDAAVRLTPAGAGTAFDVVRQGPRPTTCPASG